MSHTVDQQVVISTRINPAGKHFHEELDRVPCKSAFNDRHSTELLNRQSSAVMEETCPINNQMRTNSCRKTVSFDCSRTNNDPEESSLERKTLSYKTGMEKWIKPQRVRRQLPDLPTNSILHSSAQSVSSISNASNSNKHKKNSKDECTRRSGNYGERLCSVESVTMTREVSSNTGSDMTAIMSTELDLDCADGQDEDDTLMTSYSDDVRTMRYNCTSGTIVSDIRERRVSEDNSFTQNTLLEEQSKTEPLDLVVSEVNGCRLKKNLPELDENHLRSKVDSVTGGKSNSMSDSDSNSINTDVSMPVYDNSNNSRNGDASKSVPHCDNNSRNGDVIQSVSYCGYNLVIDETLRSVSKDSKINESRPINTLEHLQSLRSNGHGHIESCPEDIQKESVIMKDVSFLSNRPSLSVLLTYTHLLCIVLDRPLSTSDVTLGLSTLSEHCNVNNDDYYINSPHEHENEQQVDCSKYDRSSILIDELQSPHKSSSLGNFDEQIRKHLVNTQNDNELSRSVSSDSLRSYDTSRSKCEPSLTWSNTSAFSRVEKPPICLNQFGEPRMKMNVPSEESLSYVLVAVKSLKESVKIDHGGKIHEGDFIIEINGYNVTESSPDEVFQRLTQSSKPFSVVIGRRRSAVIGQPFSAAIGRSRIGLVSKSVADFPSELRITAVESSDEESNDEVMNAGNSNERIKRHYNSLIRQRRDEELRKKDDVIQQLTNAVSAAHGKCSNEDTIPGHHDNVCHNSHDRPERKLFLEHTYRDDACLYNVRDSHQEPPTCGSYNREIHAANGYKLHYAGATLTNGRKFRKGFLPRVGYDGEVLCEKSTDNQVMSRPNRPRFEQEHISTGTSNGFDHRGGYVQNGLDHGGERFLNELVCGRNNELRGGEQDHRVGLVPKDVDNQFVSLTDVINGSGNPPTNDFVNINLSSLNRSQMKGAYYPMSEQLQSIYEDDEKRGWYEINISGENCIETVYDPEHGWQRISAV